MGKELYESVLILVIMINTTCNTTFFAYKIFNCITNFIMPILIHPIISSTLIRNGIEPMKALTFSSFFHIIKYL